MKNGTLITLRNVLIADAASCAAMGMLALMAKDMIAAICGLPPSLVTAVGFILLPSAAFILMVALRASAPVWMMQLIIWLNTAWIIASLLAVITLQPTPIGIALIMAQATIVAMLTLLEMRHRAELAIAA